MRLLFGLLTYVSLCALLFRSAEALPDYSAYLNTSFLEVSSEVAFEAINYEDRFTGINNDYWDDYFQGGENGSGSQRALNDNGTNSGLNATGPVLEYYIYFQTIGTYTIYVRGYGKKTGSDSIHIGINDIPLTTSAGDGISGYPKSFTWLTQSGNPLADTTYTVSEVGVHKFSIWMREDGVVIDDIVVSQTSGLNNSQLNAIPYSILYSQANTPPVAVDDALNATEDGLDVQVNVVSNDTDADGDLLTVIGVTPGTYGSVVFNGGDVTYNLDDLNPTVDALNDGETLPDHFDYTVSDGNGGVDTGTVNVVISGLTDGPVNSPPIAGVDNLSVSEDGVVGQLNIIANDTDADGDSLFILSIQDGIYGSVQYGTEDIVYLLDDKLPAVNDLGDGQLLLEPIPYSVGDGNGGVGFGFVQVTIQGHTDVAPKTLYSQWIDQFYPAETDASIFGFYAEPDSDFINNLTEYAYELNPTVAGSGGLSLSGLSLIARGMPVVHIESTSGGPVTRVLWLKRINDVEAGLTYAPQFSSNLSTWFDSTDIPLWFDTDDVVDLVGVEYPSILPDFTVPNYFRVLVTIDTQNSAPEFDDVNYDLTRSVDAGQSITLDFDDEFFDSDGDLMTFKVQGLTGNSLGWMTWDPVGHTLSGTPAAIDAGVLDVVLTVDDGFSSPIPQFTYNIDVSALNSPPEFDDVNYDLAKTRNIGQSLVIDLDNEFFDIDGDPLTFVVQGLTGNTLAWLTWDSDDHTLIGIPGPADGGVLNITLRVDDGFSIPVPEFTYIITVDSNIPPTADEDGDGIFDAWELANGLDPSDPSDALLDGDGDRINNLQEFVLGTNPASNVSNDLDSIPDDWEIFNGLDTTPGQDDSQVDLEPDGLTNASEFALASDPNLRDHPEVELTLF